MPKERNALRAGLFIIVSAALIIGVIVAIQGLDRIVEPMQHRTVIFSLRDDVGGLRVGDDVRIGGFKVGQVQRIDVAPPADAQPSRIVVSFSMPRKYILKSGAHVAIQGTLTGTSWLNFDNLGEGGVLAPETALAGSPSFAGEVLAQIGAVAPELKQIVADLRMKTMPGVNDTVARIGQTADTFRETGQSGTKLADQLRGHVDPIVQKYHVVADRTAEMMVQIRDLIGDTKTDFRGTMANVNAATGTLKDKLPRLLDQVDGVLARVDKTVAGIHATLDDIKATAANAKDLSAAAKAALVGNKSKIDGMMASLKATGDNLKGASAEIRRSPWRLLYKPAPNEMANLNIYDSARQFAEGANDLNDAALALRDALQGQNLDKAEVEKLMQRVEKSFAGFSQVEQNLWKAVKE